jgi:hypothetical protein
MKKTAFVSTILCLVGFSAAAQTALELDYPYNPDVNTDDMIGVTDLVGILGVFGTEFTPEAITINSIELATFMTEMQNTILALQSQVETLEGTVAAMESQLVPGLASYLTVDEANDAVVFSGADVHVNNGQESTYDTNGRGNLIIGFNEPSPNVTLERSGSHNLVMGATNDYTGAGSIVTGQSNKMYATEGIVTGVNNVVTGIRSAVIGGNNNTAGGEMTVVIGGQQNLTSGNSVAIVGGLQNEAAGFAGAVVGGKSNEASGLHVVLAGGNDNLAEGQNSTVLGGSGHQAVGFSDVILGGDLGSTDGMNSVVSGGYLNHASGARTVIFGGNNNKTDSLVSGTSGFGIFGGKENIVFDGYLYGGRSNINRGQNNVIVGGRDNEMLNSFDEAGNGVYNRWSVIVGGSNTILPSTTSDFYTVIGQQNRSFVGTPGTSNHIQTGPAE